MVCQVPSLQFMSPPHLQSYLLFISQPLKLYLLHNPQGNRAASLFGFLEGFGLVILGQEVKLEFDLVFGFWVSDLQNDFFITDLFVWHLSSSCCIELIILSLKMCIFHHLVLLIVLRLMVLLFDQKVNAYANNLVFQNLVRLLNFYRNIKIDCLNFQCGLIISLFAFSVNVNFQHHEIFIEEFYL